MFLHSLNEPRGGGRNVARYDVADCDKIALGTLRKAERRHASAAREPRFQPGENLLRVANPACREIIEAGLQVAFATPPVFPPRFRPARP